MSAAPHRAVHVEMPIEAGGGSIRALSHTANGPGLAPTLILLHGALTDCEGLLPLRDTLATAGISLDAVGVDFPGHGGSDPTDAHTLARYTASVEAVVARVAADRPLIFVGESIGGIVALRFARRTRRGQVTAIVMADPPVGPRAVPYVRSAYAYMATAGGGLPPQAGPLALGMFGFDPARDAAPDFDFWPDIEAGAPCPVLALSGDHSTDPNLSLARGIVPPIFGAAEAERVRAILSEGFDWREIGGCGHMVLRLAPEPAVIELAKFLVRRNLV